MRKSPKAGLQFNFCLFEEANIIFYPRTELNPQTVFANIRSQSEINIAFLFYLYFDLYSDFAALNILVRPLSDFYQVKCFNLVFIRLSKNLFH